MTSYKVLIQKARATNKSRDAVDRERGSLAPSDGTLEAHIQTVHASIQAGIKTGNVNFIAEGLVMLEAVLKRVRSDK